MADSLPPDSPREAVRHPGRSDRQGRDRPRQDRAAGPVSRDNRASGTGQGAGSPAARPQSFEGGAPLQRNSYAAIDLGTNNCRLLIARPSGSNFTVIDAFSRVVRLGEGLAQTGRLSEEAMDRAVGALRICADKLRRRNVHLARSVATEACRRASNGDGFIERVRRETGIVLDVISAEEEARLAVLGCHILLEDGNGPAVIFDIGGGSTELVLIEPGGPIPQIVDWQSVPWGVVSLTETVGHDESSAERRQARYAEMRRLVSDSFRPFAERIAGARTPDLRLLGTSGTVTTLASVHLDLPQYDRKAVDGLIVPADSMRGISGGLSTMSPEERRRLPCIGNERADLVVAGCAILESILDIWPADRLGVADRGIREGILRSLMTADSEGELARAQLRRQEDRAMSRSGRDPEKRVKTSRGRTASSNRWLARQLNDPYVRQAKAEGYRSRAAYKLIELDEKFALLKQAKAVVDLGIAPGGWSQVVRKLAPKAKVVGIDLLPTEPLDGVTIFQMDFMADEAPAALEEALGAEPDLVLSDMAANTVGHKQTDHLRTMGLVETAADFAIQTLAPGGAFVAKVLAGGTDPALLALLKRHFATVKHAKPPASRKGSSEWYVIAQGFKGR